MRSSRSVALSLVAAMFASGCASLAPPMFAPGTAMPEVESRMGKPRDVVKAPDGDTVWQYPNGPVGQTTYMVNFGADQRVKSVYQALTLEQFAKIRPGTTTQDDIRLLLGRPGQTMFFSRLSEEVWSYRYQAAASDNRIFNVHFDAKTGTVRTTSDQIDPLFTPINYDSSNA